MYENIYYSPELFGVRPIGEIDDPDACYSFDYLVVWQHEDGRLFYGTDSGCSCPSPFEDVTSIDELTPITFDTFGAFCDAVAHHCLPYSEDRVDENAVAKVQLQAKVHSILAGLQVTPMGR